MHLDWLKSGRMSWIVHGNFTEAQAIEVVETARGILNLKPVKKDQLSSIRCLNIDGHHRIDFEVEDKANENSVLVSYFQHDLLGDDSKQKLKNEVVL